MTWLENRKFYYFKWAETPSCCALAVHLSKMVHVFSCRRNHSRPPGMFRELVGHQWSICRRCGKRGPRRPTGKSSNSMFWRAQMMHSSRRAWRKLAGVPPRSACLSQERTPSVHGRPQPGGGPWAPPASRGYDGQACWVKAGMYFWFFKSSEKSSSKKQMIVVFCSAEFPMNENNNNRMFIDKQEQTSFLVEWKVCVNRVQALW